MTSTPEHSREKSTGSEQGSTPPVHDPIARKTSAYIQTISLSSMGIEMAMCVVIGLLLGRWLDGKAGTSPALMIVFLLVGCAAAGRAVWRGVQKLDRLEKASAAASAADPTAPANPADKKAETK